MTKNRMITYALACASIPSLIAFDIVFDPQSYTKLVAQLAQMQAQYAQLVSTYEMVTSQYKQMVTNAEMLTSKSRWKAVQTPWQLPNAANTYGTTAGWINALRTGNGGASGYSQSTTKLNNYSPIWGTISSSQQDQIGRNYATVELSEGATVNALDQLGKMRGNAPAVDFAIATLENDSLSDNPALNTEVGVLNKINAATLIAVRSNQDTNKLLGSAMQRFGLHPGAQILEPSVGVGHFFGLMPSALVADSSRTGVELDSLTARIAQRLYPDATIFAKGFEDTALPDNYFDAVIGNIPFGQYSVFDPAYKPVHTRAIHDYFTAKSLDKVRPGGVMALITSRYTMDKQDSTIRRYLAERANLVGAIRLPNTAFKANAGTDVTTDILFLQKRTPGTLATGDSWCDLAPHGTAEGGQFMINEYFSRNHHMLLGQMEREGTMYRGNEPTLVGELTPEILDRAVSLLPAGIMATRRRVRSEPVMEPSDVAGVKEGAYALRDGKLLIRNGASFDSANLSATTDSRVRGMMAVRDAVRAVFQTQLEDAPEERITEARKRLNEAYDSFVRRYGALSSRDNVKAFAGDPDQPLLLSLEHYDAESRSATKTAIFERRTLERYKPIEHVETAAEALTVSLNETGDIDWQRMEQLTGRNTRQLQRQLGSLAYRNPEGASALAKSYPLVLI